MKRVREGKLRWGWVPLGLALVTWECRASSVQTEPGDDDPRPGDDDSFGGTIGRGGTSAGGAGGTRNEGATSGTGVTGGVGASGGTDPTTGGVGTGGVSTGGVGTGGEGGSSGAVAGLGSPCSPLAALACAGNHQHVTLICGADGTWQVNETCPSDQACDSTPGFDQGTCKPRVARCAAHEPGYRYCRGTWLVECGPDSVTQLDVEECRSCVDGACDDTPGSAGDGGQSGG